MSKRIAEVGEAIEFNRNGIEMFGTVYSVLDNSVVVDCTEMPDLNLLGMPERTVVNHRNYKIVGGSDKIEDYADTYKKLRERYWSDLRIRKFFGWTEKELRALKKELGMLGERVALRPSQQVKVRGYSIIKNHAAYEH